MPSRRGLKVPAGASWAAAFLLLLGAGCPVSTKNRGVEVRSEVREETALPPAADIEVGAPVELSAAGTNASVAFDGKAFTVTWLQRPERCFVLARVPLALDSPIEPARLGCYPDIGAAPRVAAGPEATVVVWGREDALVGASLKAGRLSPHFQIRGVDMTLGLAAAFDGRRFVVVGIGQEGLWTLSLSGEGQLIDERVRWVRMSPPLPLTVSLACGEQSCVSLHRLDRWDGRSTVDGVLISRGEVQQRVGWEVSTGLVSVVAEVVGHGQFVAVMSDGRRLWTKRLLPEGDDVQVVVDAPPEEAIGHLTSASDAAGMLVVWTSGQTGSSIEMRFLPSSPDAGHSARVVVPGDQPVLASANDSTFLIVTQHQQTPARPWPRLLARRLTVRARQ